MKYGGVALCSATESFHKYFTHCISWTNNNKYSFYLKSRYMADCRAVGASLPGGAAQCNKGSQIGNEMFFHTFFWRIAGTKKDMFYIICSNAADGTTWTSKLSRFLTLFPQGVSLCNSEKSAGVKGYDSWGTTQSPEVTMSSGTNHNKNIIIAKGKWDEFPDILSNCVACSSCNSAWVTYLLLVVQYVIILQYFSFF